MRNCIAAAGSRSLKKRVARIMEPVFRAKDTNHKIKRRTKVVQVFLSQKSLMRLVGSVLAEQDEIWAGERYFSEKVIAELFEKRRPMLPLTPERLTELRGLARKVIDVSLELADGMESA